MENKVQNTSPVGQTIKEKAIDKRTRLALMILLFLMLSITAIDIVFPHFVWGNFTIVNYPIHSTVEALGAIAALIMAFMPLRVLIINYKPSYLFFSIGFFTMGVWDLTHSMLSVGHGFVFSHSIALLGGGFFFILAILPWKQNITKAKIPILILISLFTSIFLFFAYRNLNILPNMLDMGQFTESARIINFLAGVLFLISVVHIFSIYLKDKSIGILILLFVAALSAIAGVTFQYSEAWTDSWWLWHVLRLAAFLNVLVYLLWRVQVMNRENREAVLIINKKNQELLESDERFRLVNEATHQGLWDWDLVNNKLYYSPIWKSQVGYMEHELENNFDTWINLLHPDDKDKSLNAVNDFINNPNDKFIIEFRFKHKKGHYVWIHNQCAAVVDKNGKVTRMFGAHTDITQSKEIFEQLRQNERKFSGLFLNDPSAIFIADPQTGLLVDVNPAAEELMEMTRNELLGMHQSQLHPQEIRLEQAEKFKNLKNSSNDSVESLVLTKSGTRKQVEIKTSSVIIENKPHLLGIFHDVSKLMEKQKRLEESERKFKTLFNSVSIPLCHVKSDGRIDAINDRFTKHLGYTIEDVPSLDEWWVKAYPDPEYRKWVINNWSMAVDESIKNNTDIQSDVYDVTTKSGEIRKMSIAGITFNNDTLATFIDLTQQIKAEESILREKEFTESIINTMPGIFYLFDRDGKFVKWNKALAEMAGISFEDVAQKKPIDFIASYDNDKVVNAIKTCFEKGEVLVEADFKAKGQNNIPFYFTGLRILMDNEPLMLGVGLNISKRKEAEKAKEMALYNLNERIKEISCLLEINEIIRDTDIGIKDTMHLISLAIPRGWHYPDNTGVLIQINNTPYKNKSYKDSSEYIQEPIMVGDQNVGFIKVTVYNLNEKQLELPFLTEEKELLRNIANNIGIYISRVESETKLKNTLEELKRSNKDLEQFAYVASHDLQEPLRMVSSYTQMLERKYKGKLDEKADKYIFYAVDGATRMQRLINDLLDFSRISTKGKAFEKVDTKEVVDRVLSSMKIKLQNSKAKIEINQLPTIIADETQLDRVFSNIIGNAIKFQKPETPPKISISAISESGYWHFTIKDNGIGIKPEFQEKIFIIFQRLHGVREYSGTGIGLAVCKQVIHRHKGKIWFESDGENGTIFHFTIKKDLKNN